MILYNLVDIDCGVFFSQIQSVYWKLKKRIQLIDKQYALSLALATEHPRHGGHGLVLFTVCQSGCKSIRCLLLCQSVSQLRPHNIERQLAWFSNPGLSRRKLRQAEDCLRRSLLRQAEVS